jgi:hypothetical protein
MQENNVSGHAGDSGWVKAQLQRQNRTARPPNAQPPSPVQQWPEVKLVALPLLRQCAHAPAEGVGITHQLLKGSNTSALGVEGGGRDAGGVVD